MQRLRVAHLRFFVPFIVLAWRASRTISDNSFLWHVRAGTVQLEQVEVLRSDVFSFTAQGEAWRTQSWLADITYGWLENLTGGIGWVPAMKFVTISLAIALVGMAIYRNTGRRSGVTLAAILILVWQAMPFAVARPVLVGFVLLAAVVAFSHMDRRPLWLLPILFWFWASVHGMYVVGLGYVFLDAIRRRSKRQFIAVCIAGAATAVTAHGLGTWWVLVQFVRNRGALDRIAEWFPPDFSSPLILPFLAVIIGLLAAATLGRLKPVDLWVVIPFLVFGVSAVRNVWPAVIVLAPLAARLVYGGDTEPKAKSDEPVVLNWAIAVVLVGVAVFGVAQEAHLSEERFPSRDAVDALDPGIQFNGSAVGGYFIYADWPDRSVFIDDRAELFGEDSFIEYQELEAGVGVAEAFERYGLEQAILDTEWPVVGYLELLGWEYRYEDDFFVVMVKP